MQKRHKRKLDAKLKRHAQPDKAREQAERKEAYATRHQRISDRAPWYTYQLGLTHKPFETRFPDGEMPPVIRRTPP